MMGQHPRKQRRLIEAPVRLAPGSQRYRDENASGRRRPDAGCHHVAQWSRQAMTPGVLERGHQAWHGRLI